MTEWVIKLIMVVRGQEVKGLPTTAHIIILQGMVESCMYAATSEGRSGGLYVGKRRGGKDGGVRWMGRQVSKVEYERERREERLARFQSSERTRAEDQPYSHLTSRHSNHRYINCFLFVIRERKFSMPGGGRNMCQFGKEVP